MNILRGLLVLVITVVLPMSAVASIGGMTHCERHSSVSSASSPAMTPSEHMHHHGVQMGTTMDHLHKQVAVERPAHGCTCGCACAGPCHTVCTGGLVMGMFGDVGVEVSVSRLLPTHTQPFIADAAVALPLRPPQLS